MINWRVASVPALKSNSLAVLRGLPIGLPSSIPFPRARTTARSVPWGWADLGRVALMTALIGAGGVFALVLLVLALSIGFTLAEGFGGVPSGSFDHLSALFGPYSAAATTLLVGGLLYGALAFAVVRYSIARYSLPWSALGFRRLSRGTLGRTAALFLPITVGGVLIMRVETVLLGSLPANPQPALLTRGMPALPTNFLLLFLLLVVITPIAEEMFFRGFLYRLLRGHFPVWAAAP
ncbi:MAG: CPBP family glutamic-type intramembrane protease, partial [Chloroflexota bacterium]